MPKTSAIERNKKRIRLTEKHAVKRAELKATLANPATTDEELKRNCCTNLANANRAPACDSDRESRCPRPDGEADVGGHLTDPLVQISGAERQPAVQRSRVPLVGAGRAVRHTRGGVVQFLLGGGDSGAATDETVDGLAGNPIRFLWEIADGGRRRRQRHRSGLGPI